MKVIYQKPMADWNEVVLVGSARELGFGRQAMLTEQMWTPDERHPHLSHRRSGTGEIE